MIEWLATVPWSPTTKTLCGESSVPTGMVTVTSAVPPAGTAEGVPASTGPETLSRWKVMASSVTKPVTVPDSVEGKVATVELLKVSVAGLVT